MTGTPGGSDSAHHLPVSRVKAQAAALLESGGASPQDADLVADELVRADQMGIPSHGVVRVGEYLDAIADGRIDPTGDCRTVSEHGVVAVVDGGARFGQVSGRYALDVATRLAGEQGAGVVVVRNSHHIGRVGALAELGARRGLLMLALVAVGIPGPVAPLGGAQGRLGTNPITYGVPVGDDIVAADFATAAMPEGAINRARASGRDVPPGVLVAADGTPTTDPNALYADPPGAILPFGGDWAHRGYALNLMVELFAGSLAGYGPHDPTRPSNCLFLLAVDPAAALPDGGYPRLAAETIEFLRSAGPAGAVLVPGEREAGARERAGDQLELDAATVAMLDERARRAGLESRLSR
jgi:LDH2 family malate/lactate/ureidoglycolate dehydrogenase